MYFIKNTIQYLNVWVLFSKFIFYHNIIFYFEDNLYIVIKDARLYS